MNKNVKIITLLVSIIVFSFTLVGCAGFFDDFIIYTDSSSPSVSSNKVSSMATISKKPSSAQPSSIAPSSNMSSDISSQVESISPSSEILVSSKEEVSSNAVPNVPSSLPEIKPSTDSNTFEEYFSQNKIEQTFNEQSQNAFSLIDIQNVYNNAIVSLEKYIHQTYTLIKNSTISQKDEVMATYGQWSSTIEDILANEYEKITLGGSEGNIEKLKIKYNYYLQKAKDLALIAFENDL